MDGPFNAGAFSEGNAWSTVLTAMGDDSRDEAVQDIGWQEAHAGLHGAQQVREARTREALARLRDDDEDEDAGPPDSLLVEHAPEHNAAHGGEAFVRRAAHAVRSRMQEIGGQAGVARFGGPMAPPRQRRGRSRQADMERESYRDRAMRAWRDARHQDDFFCRVYAYYVSGGATAMIVTRALQLATAAVVVGLATFVFGCVDHSKVRSQKSLAAVVVPQCMSKLPWTATLALWAVTVAWIAQAVRAALDVPSVLEMRAFYEELGIQGDDLATAAWHEVVERMVQLRARERAGGSARSAGSRRLAVLTADGVVGRIMRRENYMLALFSGDVLDVRVPGLGRAALSKALQWNLAFCVGSYAFDERGQLRRRFLRESNRAVLSAGLRRRFRFVAVVNLLLAPLVAGFLLLYGFFRYFEELYRAPGMLGARDFTPLARMRLRNLNEVPHAFRRRLASARPKAALYVAQFRNAAMVAGAQFVAFVAGAVAALLLAFSVVDNELSLEFEITPRRTVLFYLGLSSAILAGARAMAPPAGETIHPAWILRDALEDLQYMKPEWRGQLASTRVRRDFEALFSLKLLIFAHELLGVVAAPAAMLLTLPNCAERVVDFLRDFTVRDPALGYVCSLSTFDFARHGNARFAAPTRAAPHMASKHGKMEQSFLAFKADYPEWQPRDRAAELFLERAQAAQADLWRTGGWQDRLLQQQRMAGSVFPTGASLYQQGPPGPSQGPSGPLQGSVRQGPVRSSGPQGPLAPSQAAFQPLAGSQAPPLQFGPTLAAAGRPAPSDRLALSALPLVASPEMGRSLIQPGTFSILNELYEQQEHAAEETRQQAHVVPQADLLGK
ncbi:autophagy protein atg9 [Coemansia sp. RSA 552]|nr:autophagy protein atg9 [Coemansia sp. RSA 552]